MNSWSFVYIFFWLQGQTPSSVLKVFCFLVIPSLMVSSVILLLDKSLRLLINFLDFYSPLTVRSPALLEHLCITAGMQKGGKETWGRINHYLLSEDASGELLSYHPEPIQFIKSTNYLLLLNPFFVLIYLPLDGWLVGFFLSECYKIKNTTRAHSLPFFSPQCYCLFCHYHFRAFLVGSGLKVKGLPISTPLHSSVDLFAVTTLQCTAYSIHHVSVCSQRNNLNFLPSSLT